MPLPRAFQISCTLLGLAGLGMLLSRFGGAAIASLAAGFHPAAFAQLLVAIAGAMALAATRWLTLLRGLGVSPSLTRLCALRAASQSIAAVLPGGRLGGEPLRVWYAIEVGVPAPAAITTVAMDRTIEMATSLAFAVVFALILGRAEVPGLDRTLGGVLAGAAGFGLAIAMTIRRLRGSGLIAPLLRALGTTWASAARDPGIVDAAEDAARRLLGQPGRLGLALAIGIAADMLTLVQYHCLLRAFDLPSTPTAVVAAIFAAGAARTLPVPGGVGTVEAAELWIFEALGYPPHVGLAVGLVTRLRDVAWAAPGLVVLLGRTLWPTTRVAALFVVTPDIEAVGARAAPRCTPPARRPHPASGA